jgi:hypothetical protein
MGWARAGQGPDKAVTKSKIRRGHSDGRLLRSAAELLELLFDIGFEPVAKSVR